VVQHENRPIHHNSGCAWELGAKDLVFFCLPDLFSVAPVIARPHWFGYLSFYEKQIACKCEHTVCDE